MDIYCVLHNYGINKMTTNWKEYTESDDQIAEIISATSGILIRNRYKEEAPNIWKIGDEWGVPLSHLKNLDIKGEFAPYEYLICTPHPLADMIIRHAQTGQPVWIRTPAQNFKVSSKSIICIGQTYSTTTPDWNIPNAEYSFAPFEG